MELPLETCTEKFLPNLELQRLTLFTCSSSDKLLSVQLKRAEHSLCSDETVAELFV